MSDFTPQQKKRMALKRDPDGNVYAYPLNSAGKRVWQGVKIGSLTEGIDIEKVKQLHKEYSI